MAWVKDEIGRAVGLPREIGGIPLDEIGATGLGVAVAAETAQEFAGFALKGARVAVQGYGAVGRHAARFLKDRGALVVAVADSKGTLIDPHGLELDALDALKREGRSVTDASSGEKRSADAILDVSCEIWIPAAQPDVLREDNVDRLRAKLVVEGANIPARPEAEARLNARGVTVVPDFIANAGGVICGSVEYHGGTQSAALALIEEKLRANTREVLAAARRQAATPRAAATQLAQERVRRAMDGRRRF
jgi:glutamate dehydrogenase (NAD(P)+)